MSPRSLLPPLAPAVRAAFLPVLASWSRSSPPPAGTTTYESVGEGCGLPTVEAPLLFPVVKMAQSSILIPLSGLGVASLEKTTGMGGLPDLVVVGRAVAMVAVGGSVGRGGAAAAEESSVLVPAPVTVEMQGPAGADLAVPGRGRTTDFPSAIGAAADRMGTEGRRHASWSWLRCWRAGMRWWSWESPRTTPRSAQGDPEPEPSEEVGEECDRDEAKVDVGVAAAEVSRVWDDNGEASIGAA